MKLRHILLLGVATLTGLVVILVTLVLVRPYEFKGTLFDPPVPAADFTLTDQHGQPFRLSDQRGKVVLIFFGFTNCPDVCPVTLSDFKQIRSHLGNTADRVRFVFITVDPERDSLETMKAHLANFDPAIVGLTGDSMALEAVYQTFWIFQEKVDVGSAAGYVVDHTSRVYVIDKHGDLRLTFPFGTEWQKMAEDIRVLVMRD